MADDEHVSQNEIEQLLQQAKAASGQSPDAPPPGAEEQAGQGASPQNQAEPSQSAAGASSATQHPTGRADSATIDQSQIDSLLNSGESPQTTAPATGTTWPQEKAAGSQPASEAGMHQTDVDFLLQQAEQALASIDDPAGDLPPEVAQFQFRDFTGSPPSTEAATLDLVREVQLDVTIELGRTWMNLEDVLKLKKGAVVALDKLAGDPVDIYVNGRLVARGEVLVLNENFCVRVAELVQGESAVA